MPGRRKQFLNPRVEAPVNLAAEKPARKHERSYLCPLI